MQRLDDTADALRAESKRLRERFAALRDEVERAERDSIVAEDELANGEPHERRGR